MSIDPAYVTASVMSRDMIRYNRDTLGVSVTREMIEQSVNTVIQLRPEWQNLDVIRIIAEIELECRFWIGEASTLEDNKDHVRWLDQSSDEIQWAFWNRYKKHLQNLGWAEASVDKLDSLCSDILGLLENPQRENNWDRRGMVVGRIQSGKTANYIGLINKAIDSGYKVIVVLAGVHNSLRSQTQIRLDEGVLGYDSIDQLGTNAKKLIGVGKIVTMIPSPDTITTRADNGDFQTRVARNFHISPGQNPLLFVIKKNGRVLRNILNWVRWSANTKDNLNRVVIKGIPLLLIDDEADFGSIDTSELQMDEHGLPDPDHDPTTINKLIRQMLASFEKSAYVGYTATPFANIFIHDRASTREEGDDLFPRSFIISLPSPSNYTGPKELFGITAPNEPERLRLPLLRVIRDNVGNEIHPAWMPQRHNSSHIPLYNGTNDVPPSLNRAILSFILSTAARNVRGHNDEHKSMLIHVTRFVYVQDRVYAQVDGFIKRAQIRIQRETNESVGTLLNELLTIWNEDFVPTLLHFGDQSPIPVTWQSIITHLSRVILSIEVRQINGTSRDILDYNQTEPKNIIAIGGDKLSRGLTLEGLSVSYFLRASKMYDTLMQMGRWFGYRNGYLDLCRLYTTSELVEWFSHIADAEEELRQEFDRMAKIGATPLDYGLRVRSHPSLLVTSQVKMRQGTELEYSCQGRLFQTLRYFKSGDPIEYNYRLFQTLIQTSTEDCAVTEFDPSNRRLDGTSQTWQNSILLRSVNASRVTDFLDAYLVHKADVHLRLNLLSRYIKTQNTDNRLINWTILVRSGTGTNTHQCLDRTMNTVVRNWRSRLTDEEKETKDFYWIRSTLTPRDELVDLTNEEYIKAGQLSGDEVRCARPVTRGLLIIYPIQHIDQGDSTPLIGFAISFPSDAASRPEKYIVNNVFEQSLEN